MRKFRLRWNEKIVGYAEEKPDGILYKGKEWLWFMRGKPRYNKVDSFIGVKDKLHRDIYELDIVLYKLNSKIKNQQGVILWSPKQDNFVLYNYTSKEVIPIFLDDISLFENDKLEIVSHLFTQPELKKKIKWKFD